MPNRNTVLLISPETDVDNIQDEDKSFLKFFHGGNTIFDFLYEFDYDELLLLEKLQSFIENKYLILSNFVTTSIQI